MAIISREHRFLFIMAPRTGCTAIAQLLRDELGAQDIPERDDERARRAKIPPKHVTLGQLLRHGMITPAERAELFAFSAVRNPFDSVVSLYLKQASSYQELLDDPDSFINRSRLRRQSVAKAANSNFEEWLAANYRQSALRRLAKPRGRRNKWIDGVDFVMRYERLQADFDEAMRRAGVERRLVIPKVNVTSGRVADYRTYYTEQARRIVEQWFGEELRQFGYQF